VHKAGTADRALMAPSGPVDAALAEESADRLGAGTETSAPVAEYRAPVESQVERLVLRAVFAAPVAPTDLLVSLAEFGVVRQDLVAAAAGLQDLAVVAAERQGPAVAAVGPQVLAAALLAVFLDQKVV
jgi:hypothetical protein